MEKEKALSKTEAREQKQKREHSEYGSITS